MIIAVPPLMAVTFPLAATEAILTLLLLHVMLLSDALTGRTVAVRSSLLPTARVRSSRLRRMLVTGTATVTVQ